MVFLLGSLSGVDLSFMQTSGFETRTAIKFTVRNVDECMLSQDDGISVFTYQCLLWASCKH